MSDVNYIADTENALRVYDGINNVVSHASANGELFGTLIAIFFILAILLGSFLIFKKFF